MNKKTVLLGILIIIVTCFLTTGCIFYNLLNSKDFSDYFAALGYEISDSVETTYEYENNLVATKGDVPFKIEYYSFDDEVEAKKAYKKMKEKLPYLITSNSKDNELTSNVMSKYICKSDNEYIIISRVKNTIIFINGTQEYSSEIDNLLTDIRY